MTIVGPFIVLLVFLAGLVNAAFDTVEERIETLIERKAEEQEGVEEKPASWHQIKAVEKKEVEKKRKKDRYTRGFRDILRPWDYH